MKFWKIMPICLLLVGCDTAMVSDNQSSYDHSKRLLLKEKAEKGSAEAQFELGNSYCCGEDGFWSTKEAVRWWCKAATQAYEPAKLKLQKLHLKCDQ